MKAEIQQNGTLKISVDTEERAELKVLGETILQNATVYDFLEPLVCNSAFSWIDPSECGDLTDAPMLGIRDQEGNVTGRWAFMDYQVRSVLEDLRDKGEAIFVF